MAALNKVGRRYSHIITKIVETKFVVSTEGDVCLVSLTTFR